MAVARFRSGFAGIAKKPVAILIRAASKVLLKQLRPLILPSLIVKSDGDVVAT
jgi:hypothetical protein